MKPVHWVAVFLCSILASGLVLTIDRWWNKEPAPTTLHELKPEPSSSTSPDWRAYSETQGRLERRLEELASAIPMAKWAPRENPLQSKSPGADNAAGNDDFRAILKRIESLEKTLDGSVPFDQRRNLDSIHPLRTDNIYAFGALHKSDKQAALRSIRFLNVEQVIAQFGYPSIVAGEDGDMGYDMQWGYSVMADDGEKSSMWVYFSSGTVLDYFIGTKLIR